MATYDEDIDQTVRMVWEAMVALPLQRVDPEGCTAGPAMTGIVVLDGDFEGAVEVACDGDLARRIAGVMFAEVGAVTPADVSDALGEVSNMVAGNLKTSLPGHNSIGLPIVATGNDYELAIPGADLVGQATYSSDGDCLRIRLMRHNVA